MTHYNLISENTESTVVSEYESEFKQEANYQSESDLEKAFIKLLEQQAYSFLPINSEKDLIDNLRVQLEKLNNYQFTEKEWKDFFSNKIANPNHGIEQKTAIIQEDYIQLLHCDNGMVQNIRLLDKENIHNNQLQIINQYETDEGQRPNRYDVTVLVNGIPIVHIELKRRGVSLQEAFNQINRYSRESFWAGSGLFEYVQLFIISNGTLTKYYSNTTRFTHIKEKGKESASKRRKTSNSYEFTSWWADANNKPILDLVDFGKTFFAKHTILNILTKYCVFTADKLLLVMRPYQIVATERILEKIKVSNHYKRYGSIDAGGFVWHTTGSGKTLTSFKTAQLISKQDFVEKVIFVVDRKDLDYQTMKEYDKFEKGAANSNTDTAVLTKQLDDSNARIIITTIQKLSILIKRQKNRLIYGKPVVFIFDECHRSQFGDMHEAITKAFKKYFLFGFTGTPIFAVNANSSGKTHLKTTVQAFGCYKHGNPKNCTEDIHQSAIHTYTVVNAIADKNVLPFRVDYISTMKEKEDIEETKVRDIDRERALMAPQRIWNNVNYILKHFDQKTSRNSKPYYMTALSNVYEVASAKDRNKIEEIKEKIRRSGFNSIFAVASIQAAKLYYEEFKRQQKEIPELARLKVATIFSFGQNDAEEDGVEDENSESTEGLNSSDRDFLNYSIQDYNQIFKTTYDTSPERFQNYYKDVSLRMKNREIDLLIVVNMFLTGFDATTLNTLWVDKNLQLHGLLQAYSRTNRILNSIKTFGNIVCFRNLEDATNKSLALFGNNEAGGIILLKTYIDYYHGYNDGKIVPGYFLLINDLIEKFPIGISIQSEEAKKEFIKLYGGILKLLNVLKSFDEFDGNEILSERDFQDYHSMYIELYNEFRNHGRGDSENVNDDIVFEMELIKQVEINIDYILMLIRKYQDSHLEDNEIIININKAIDSSVDLRNKKELIEKFVASLTPASSVDEEWIAFVKHQKKAELDQIISTDNLKVNETYAFINNAFKNGEIQAAGTSFANILPPVSRFSPTGDRSRKKEIVLEKLISYFNRYYDISGNFE